MGGKWPRNVILTKISVACDHGWGVSSDGFLFLKIFGPYSSNVSL